MSKRSNACEFNKKERQAIYERDKNRCIFCSIGYRMSSECGGGLQVAHYIARSQNGLGIAENGALVCVYHHQLLDNSSFRDEMKKYYKEYLMSFYPKWNEKELVYSKWNWIEMSQNDKGD